MKLFGPFHGSINGAIESGERAAREVLQAEREPEPEAGDRNAAFPAAAAGDPVAAYTKAERCRLFGR